MRREELALNRITLDNGRVLMEIYDKEEGVWEYYINEDGTLVFSFGVGIRFTLEELTALDNDGYFD